MNIKEYPVTIATIILCILIWLLQYTSKKDAYGSSPIISKFGLIPLQVKRGQYYRILSSGFLHVRPYHILMNLYALYNLGSSLEPFVGSFNFALILYLSIIGGGIACTYLSEQTTTTIGISGGVFGLLAAYAVILFRLGLFSDPSIVSNIGYVVIVNVFISMMPGVSWQGHLGGALVGLILSFILF